ncbi:hypothetical protein TMPK1_16040 [Rhodospirillales bacterium TMPK1]|uniref:Uncharacterized protein n=1 Tax=Roseiterribacter gracilis TaxID=2812848 RepID=A0A8S8XDG8_9PROT|nr:hypothetical protein TMPK1_16040 [Rhodospirillales bacterium TMPK1]
MLTTAVLSLLAASAAAEPSKDATMLDTMNMMTVFRGACVNSMNDEAKAADIASKLQLKVAGPEARKLMSAKDGDLAWEPGTAIRLKLPSGEMTDGRYYLSLSKPWTCQVRAMSADAELIRESVKKIFTDMQAQAKDPRIELKPRLDKTQDVGGAKVRQTEWVYGGIFLIYVYTIAGCPHCAPHMVGITSMAPAK